MRRNLSTWRLKCLQFILAHVFREPTLLAELQHGMRTNPLLLLYCVEVVTRQCVADVIIPKRFYDFFIADTHPALSARLGEFRLLLIRTLKVIHQRLRSAITRLMKSRK